MKVELIGIDKSFGKLLANDNIHLCIPSGTIQGILGENGAGKSTLMKVLSGYIQADGGKIILNGQPTQIHSPADAIRQGIGMLHQDPLDFPPMKVIENFILGSEILQTVEKTVWRYTFPDWKTSQNQFTVLQEQFGFNLDPEAYVDSLTVGERQQLEILRLLLLGVRVIILDEPTTGISASQKVKLFSTLQQLANQGKTVIFVSHKLEDVEQLCNQVAVLRRGQMVGQVQPPYQTDELVNMMFGKLISLGEREAIPIGSAALTLRELCIEDYRMKIGPVDLIVSGGEVIGLAGMEGSGQIPFLRACSGLIRTVAGNVLLNGKDMTSRSYHAFRRKGVAYLPAARLEEGLIPGLSLTEHFLLSEESRKLFIDWKDAQSLATQRIDEFFIRGSPATSVEALSGGNQQRMLLALFKTNLSLLLMEHPTRGLDVESTLIIWRKLKDRCRQGLAIIFISSDLDEILRYSDRILVFFTGRVSSPLPAAETTIDQLRQLMGGKGW